MNIKIQTIVNLSPKETMQMYLDPEIWVKIVPNYIKYELEDGTYDKKGNVVRYYMKTIGKPVVVEQELVEIIEGEKVVLKSTSKDYKGIGTATFEEVDGKTKIKETADVIPNFIIRLFFPLLKKQMQRKSQNLLDTLAEEMEKRAKETDTKLDEISEDN